MRLSLPPVGAVLERWGPHGRTALRILGLAVLVAFVLPFLIYAVPTLVGAEGSYVVLSGSMEPAIAPGDVVFVYATDPPSIEVGDIVTYSREDAQVPTTHRVIEVIETNDVPSGVLLRTMGDANEDPDQVPVAGGAVHGIVPAVTLPVLGTVLFVFPAMGHVIQFANTTPGFLLLVGLPLGAFILNEIWTVARGGVRQDPEADSSADSADVYGERESAAKPSLDDDALTAPATSGSPPITPTDVLVGQADLKASIAILGVVSVYAIWVAYSVFTPWSVSVAVAAVGSFMYLAALRYRVLSDLGRSSGPETSRAGASIPDGGDTIESDGQQTTGGAHGATIPEERAHEE